MPLPKTRDISINRYFVLPLLVWVVVGGIMLLLFSQQQLFHAVNTHYTDWANVLLYYVTFMGQAEVIVPALLLLMLLPAFRNWWYFALATTCNVVPFFIQQALKSAFDMPRPRLLYYDRLWMHYLPDWPVYLTRSFPSGHSAGAFSFFCFLALLLPAGKRAFGLLFFFMALLVCYSRMYLAEHFFEDVYAGSILGAGITIVLFVTMNNFRQRMIKGD